MSRPILVTGAPRSGTTWVGEMLAAGGDVLEEYEPFNPRSRRSQWFEVNSLQWYLYLDDKLGEPWVPAMTRMHDLRYPVTERLGQARRPHEVKRVLTKWREVSDARRRHKRLLMKDPTAFFMAEWLADRFGLLPVVVVRHPAAFVASALQMNWRPNFKAWLRQDLLMESLLAPWAKQLEDASTIAYGNIHDLSLFWNVFTDVSRQYRDRHDEWCVVRHEDLCTDPVRSFRELYDRVGLTFNDRAAAAVGYTSDAANPTGKKEGVQHALVRDSAALTVMWKDQLAPATVAQIREITGEVSETFFDDSSWR